MYTKKMNEGAEAQATQATTAERTAEQAAALAAGGNSLGGARAEGDAPFANSSTDGLLLSATDLLALVELEPLNTEESTKMLQVLGAYHHAIFSRRVDTAVHIHDAYVTDMPKWLVGELDRMHPGELRLVPADKEPGQ